MSNVADGGETDSGEGWGADLMTTMRQSTTALTTDEVLSNAEETTPDATLPGGGRRLRLLSYNIQTGIASQRYRHYITQGWKHVLPHASRWSNLDSIARALRSFDIVGLQEVDSGSLRTGFINQTKYLAEQADFPYWHCQTNRRLGKFAQHSNAFLSRLIPSELIEQPLPGLPGRGVLIARFGTPAAGLSLFVLHLALGRRTRLRQIAYLADLVNEYAHVIVMGDLNCGTGSQELKQLLRDTDLQSPPDNLNTFPSWQPRWRLDHILLSPGMDIERAYIPDWLFSDHLPMAMDVVISSGIELRPMGIPGVGTLLHNAATAG
jgi:endonuclease/exonuclease/phosphatase family metal-dependent hydrolase